MSQPKRQVSYNQEAVLCPACKKRIRLNNNGRIRVHISGKAGSGYCMGSNAEPALPQLTLVDVENQIAAGAKSSPAPWFQKDPLFQPPLFSDLPE